MTAVDWVLVALVALFAFYGYLQGFVVGALGLVGFALGAFIGSRLGPAVLSGGKQSPYAAAFALGGALLIGALFASGLERLGFRVRRRLSHGALGALDGLLGAVLTAAVALGIGWISAAVALQTAGPGGLRLALQRSSILHGLDGVLPPPGPVLNALARFDPLPALRGQTGSVPPPRAAILRDPQVRGARASVVRVLGTACGLGIEGSGWVAGPGTVVTNAHVVAGESDTVVEAGGQPPNLVAKVVHFDPRNDVAVLRVGGLSTPSLRLASDPSDGTAGAILGYPRNGPYRSRAARIGATHGVVTDNAYGQGPVRRRLTPIRGVVRSGNSGGPVVGGDGRVLTTVFAATTGHGPPGGFGVANAIVRRALSGARAGHVVPTGPCAG